MTAPTASDESVTLEVEDLAYGGAGIARMDGLIVFVPGAVPGDVVRARLRKRKPRFAEAELLDVIDPSPMRILAPCPHFGQCGGCHWMNIPYERQLAFKERQVADHLAKIGRLEGFTQHPIVPSPKSLRYRNKMEFTFETDPNGLFSGLHAASDPERIEEIHECLLQPALANRILRWVTEECRALGLEVWGAGQAGLLHRLAIRTAGGGAHASPEGSTGAPGLSKPAGPETLNLSAGLKGPESVNEAGEPGTADLSQMKNANVHQAPRTDDAAQTLTALVVLVTRDRPFPGAHDLARKLRGVFPEVTGVGRTILREDGSEKETHALAGELLINDTVEGLRLTATAGAFLQVNPAQAVQLYRKVLECSLIESHESALDLYCGVGSITLLLGRRARRAVGVEASPESVRCAKRNADANAVQSCRFIHGDALRVANLQAREGERYDLVILNPPRTGIPEPLVGVTASLTPKRVVYVSCDPSTLARDLARFTRAGYRTTDVTPFDMFPQTFHVEAVARLERRSR